MPYRYARTFIIYALVPNSFYSTNRKEREKRSWAKPTQRSFHSVFSFSWVRSVKKCYWFINVHLLCWRKCVCVIPWIEWEEIYKHFFAFLPQRKRLGKKTLYVWSLVISLTRVRCSDVSMYICIRHIIVIFVHSIKLHKVQ